MLPVIAIVGRPNVGKSTLFNRLTRTQQALVANMPGVTRDRIYSEGQFENHSFIVIDTGGLIGEKEGIQSLTEKQTWLAVQEADAILFVVDARSGLVGADEEIVKHLRQVQKPIYIVVNKVDEADVDIACAEFYRLGLGEPHPVTASHGTGVNNLMQIVLAKFPPESEIKEEENAGIKIAIVGRPNVGKSTLINRILGEERVLVFDQPGTTRDSIYIPFQRNDKKYVLIDTAGVRRRRGIKEAIEKFSVIKTLQAIEAANVVVVVIDAHETIVEQDLRLLGFALEAGKALVIAVNKWDGLQEQQREYLQKELDRRLSFASFARIHFISALHGSGVGNIFTSIDEAYAASIRKLSTSELTKILNAAVASHQPPAPQGRLIKLRYAHAGGHNPPIIVIHGKQTDSLPDSYQRYLANYFREALKMVGTPIQIELISDDNPYDEG